MSCTAILPTLERYCPPRKRTSSFSSPKPAKAARTSPLRRTDSFISIADALDATPRASSSRTRMHDCSSLVAPSRTLRHYKEQRQARHRGAFTTEPQSFLSIGDDAEPAPPRRVISPFRHRTSSPLAPTQTLLPPRPAFPRSKRDTDADLYRRALLARMRGSPEGHKILVMGARLAVSMLTATRDLERLVADAPDGDVVMADAWVAVQEEEWEMVES